MYHPNKVDDLTVVDEKPMKKIFLFLSGIKGYDKDAEFSEISDEANRLVRSFMQQKKVWVVLECVDQWSNFLGQVVINKQGDNLSCMLFNLGFTEVYPASADRSLFKEKLVAAQAWAQETKKGRWENWSPEQVIEGAPVVNGVEEK